MSFEVILPFLRPIEHLIRDGEVSEIMVNGSGRVFIEKHGQLLPVPDAGIAEKSLEIAVRNIARTLGDEVNENRPLLDARLPDGSRVAAAIPPCSRRGTTLTIRKFPTERFTPQALVRNQSIREEGMEYLARSVRTLKNILISGSTASGKTTLLNALAHFMDSGERVIVIEDTSEIQITLENLVELEARREQPDQPAVTIRDLLRATLRHRPDRIVLGEVRGPEAFDLLQALNTGHSGLLSTIHANSARQALSRLTTWVLESGVELPYRAIRAHLGDAIDLIVHMDRHRGHRQVVEMLEVSRYDPSEDKYEFRRVYTSQAHGEQREPEEGARQC